MVIIEIAAIVLFIGFMISIINAEKDWATWTAIGSIVGLWLCFTISFVTEPKRPKTIKTTCPPQIDTIITIKNKVSDTIYVYTFIQKGKEQ